MIELSAEMDVRALSPSECVTKLLVRLDRLRPGEAFVLVSVGDPSPVQRWLEAERPHLFDWEPLDGATDCHRARVRRRLHGGRRRGGALLWM